MEIYDKSQVERHINLDDKISIIFPSILEVKTPKGTAVWQEYIQLKKLRDRIIHMKSDDRKSTGPEENTIWYELFKPIVPHRVAKDIIDYLLPITYYLLSSTEKKPLWYLHYALPK